MLSKEFLIQFEIIKSNKEIPREGIKNLELGVRDMKRLLAKPEKDLIEGLKIIIESWNLGARQIEYFLEKKKKEEENSSMSNFL